MKARPLLRGGAPVPPGVAAPTRILETSRFGRIAYGPGEVIWSSRGLCTHEHHKRVGGSRYLLRPWSGNDKLMWLQSIEFFDCAQLVTDPAAWGDGVDEYRPEVDHLRLRELGLGDLSDENASVLALVTDPNLDRAEPIPKALCTMNLAQPIVLNTRSRRAELLADPKWTTRRLIDPAKAEQAGGGG